MRTTYLTIVAAAVLSATALRAQTPQTNSPSDQSAPPYPPPPPAPPPPPPASAPVYGYGYGWQRAGSGPGMSFAGAVTVPYAFNWNAPGISAELGGLWSNSHFFGGEVSTYDGEPQRYNVFNNSGYVGHFYSSQQVTTLQLAYRYFGPRWDVASWVPVSLYFGVSGGGGYVNYSNNPAVFGFRNDDAWHWSGEVLAGIQLNTGSNSAFRVGYRYIAVSGVWRFSQSMDIDSGALEAGFAFRF